MSVTPRTFPEMAMVKQRVYRAAIADIPQAVSSALNAANLSSELKPGHTVAIAVGNRGISGIETVVGQCIEFFRSKEMKPFIVPAMGSHGGATAEGQRLVLEKLGINEGSLDVAIHAEMSVNRVGQLSNGTEIFFSKTALSADHIVVINRVKPHTKFQADIESGLCKMLTIGLGKAAGAAEFHRQAIRNSFSIIEDAARVVLQNCSILCGLALVEDGYGDLSLIEALPPERLVAGEKKLLKEAVFMMGRIPFNDIDILVIDQFGKDLSGIGMDSNITGRHRDIVGDFSMPPHVKRIFVRDLSPGSDGNGNGIGLADVTTRRLVEHLDLKKTYMNAVTAISPEKAAIPIHVDTDREAIDICARTSGLVDPSLARLVRITDTKYLEKVQVSRALKVEVEDNPNLALISPWRPMAFDTEGNLLPMTG
jgi:hypothetical protein